MEAIMALLSTRPSCSCSHALLSPPTRLQPSSPSRFTSLLSRGSRPRREILTSVCAVQTPKGFGPVPPPKKKAVKKVPDVSDASRGRKEDDWLQGAEGGKKEDESDDDVVPEVVTNRMLKRLAFTVGVPLFIGVMFFPAFYYLKVVQKVDVPEWLPVLCSIFTFGGAGFGITYGIISTSWDPVREGSLLGWKEAQANWPVFWDTARKKE